MSFESDELMSSKVMSNIAHHLRSAGRSDELLKLITHQAKIAYIYSNSSLISSSTTQKSVMSTLTHHSSI
jgi:hypothetical protein